MRSRHSCLERRDEIAEAVGHARMKPRHKRVALIAGGLAALGVAAAMILNAFQSNLVFFFSPSQVLANEGPSYVTPIPILRNTTAIPVSWHTGRFPLPPCANS